jgi:methionine sulfoxide reductase heme-binding subunit
MLASNRWTISTLPATGLWQALVASALLLMSLGLVLPDGALEDWRTQVRATARTSWLLFMGVFLSAGWPSEAAAHMPVWQARLMRHRSLLTACFIWSHGLHAMGIAMLAVLGTPEEWARLTPTASRWIGGAGYAAIGLWLLWRVRRQSSGWRVPDVAARSALWLVWAVFWLACAKRAPMQPLYALPALAMLAALWWRWQIQRKLTLVAGAVTPVV